MLEEPRRPGALPAVLEEVARVRAEMGYPIIVTPVSQLVATQAVRNILDGERWATVSDEMVRLLPRPLREPAAPVDPEVADRVLSRPRAEELRHRAAEPGGGAARFGRKIPDEELLLRLTMPDEQVDAMLASPPIADGGRLDGRPSCHPIVTLLREVEKRTSVTHLRVQAGDEVVEWRRAT